MSRKISIFKNEIPLKFLVEVHEYVVGHKIIIPSIYLITILRFALGIVTCLDFIINGQAEVFFKNYSMYFFMSFYVVTYLAVEYFFVTGSKEKFEELKSFREIETATFSTQKKIHARIRVIYFGYNFNLFWILTQASLSIFIGFFTDSFLYPEKIYLRKVFVAFPKIELILECFVNISHTLWIALPLGLCMFLKYVANVLSIRLHLLSDFIKRTDSLEISGDESIEKHLKICCAQHVSLCRYFHEIDNLLCITIPFFVPAAAVYFLGGLVCVYYNVNFFDKLQAYGLLLMGILLMTDIVNDGQNVQDQFELLSTNLVGTKWYNWNETNKKIMLMMIIRSQQRANVEALGIQVNRTLIIRLTRIVYQIFLVFQSTM